MVKECEMCGSKKIKFEDEFQTLCRTCHLDEVKKELDYFLDISRAIH